MKILINHNFKKWSQALVELDSNLQCIDASNDNIDNPDFALLWSPSQALIDQLQSVKIIFSMGAGVETILNKQNLPDCPIIKLQDDELVKQMRFHVVHNVLHIYKNMFLYQQNQINKKWQSFSVQRPESLTIGVLGLGQLGADCALSLNSLGFNVIGWSKSKKHLENISTFEESQLEEFLPLCQILICLLPLTATTQGILNKKLFNQLPKGASIINVARGGHLNDQDLLNALNEKQISYACLDVFHEEPLPNEHFYWHHPNVFLTPHIASQTRPTSAVKHIVNNIENYINNIDLTGVVNKSNSY